MNHAIILSLVFVSLGLGTSSHAATSNEDLESCYDKIAVVQETKTSDTTSTKELLSEDEMASRCNKAVIKEAQSEKDIARVLTLAGIIGRKSNWASAAPVYAIGAKLDQKKACEDQNAIDSMKAGLAHPSDYPPVKGALQLADACFPVDKDMLSHLVSGADDSYTAKNLCPFIKTKKISLTKIGQSICDKAQ